MGNHVAFREAPDLHTAAHEAAHVVQQRAGVQVTDGVGATGDAYEQNADAVADAVVAGGSAEGLLSAKAGNSDGGGAGATKHDEHAHEAKPAGGAVQRKAEKAAEPACANCGGAACECGGAGNTDGAAGPARAASKAAGSKAVQLLIDESAPVQLQDGPEGDQPGDGGDGGAGWTPPAGCPTNFCQPYSSPILAELDKQARWPILRAGIAVKVGAKAAVLWELWANGGTGVIDMSGLFGGDFAASPTTASTAAYLRGESETAVRARTAPEP